MDTPKLAVYLTNLTWTPNTTSMLVPSYQEVEGLYLAHMTLWFFLLSALAHGIIAVGNYRQAFAVSDPEAQRITRWTGWYYVWIHQCRQPLRWLEYSFSASLMGITIAVAGGINHLYMLVMVFSLLWCTMLFGYYTEVTSPPLSLGPEEKPKEWLISAARPELLAFPELPATLQRLAPHLLGYGPYITVWAVLFHSFFYNVSDADQGPPAFVYIIVVGQLLVFTAFGITQLANQISASGPEWYFWSEVSYQFLSLFAKGLLGLTLVANVLVYDSFDEAVSSA